MIHIIDYLNTDSRHMDHWQTVVPYALTDEGYEVNLIHGTNPALASSEWNLSGEIYYKTTQFEQLYKELITKNISRGDILIFGDAWNPTAISLKYLNLILNMDLTLIGFWRDGIYDINSKIRTGLLAKPKRWAKSFERSLYGVYDFNCFISQEQADRFNRRYRLKSMDGEAIISGLPYEKLLEVRKQYSPVVKENIIVLPHDAADADQRDIFKALRNHLSDYTFIDCYDMKMTSSEYYSILNRAKAVLAINLSESDPTNIYEGMLFGCVPIIPDNLIYKEIFPEIYHYPCHYTQPPFLNFVRGRDYMHERVDVVFREYNNFSQNLERDSKIIGEKYFSNNKLITLLKNIKNARSGR